MASINWDDIEDACEGYNNAECVLPARYNANNANQVEEVKGIPSRNVLLRKLEEALSDPVHRRLLGVYASINTSSAKESMEHELAHILLEVLDRAN